MAQVGDPTSVIAGEELERETRAGVSAAWERVNEVLLSRLAGTYSVVWEYTPGSPQGRETTRKDFGTHEFLALGKQMKIINRVSGGERVGALNGDYWFNIARKDDKSRFTIERLVPQNDPSAQQRELLEDYRAERLNEILSAWYLLGDPFAEVLQRPQFVVRDAHNLETTGHRKVRVDFTYAMPGHSPPLLAAGDGSYVVLDPVMQWCLVEFELQVSWGVERGEYEYEDAIDGFPKLRRMRLIQSNQVEATPAVKVATKVVSFSRLERPVNTTDIGGFRLPDYGFPEPNFEARRSQVYLWYFLIAIGCLVCGVLLYRRRSGHR